MCGIAGIVRITPPSAAGAGAAGSAHSRPHADAIPETWLDVLDASVRHRGPDGQGRFRDRAIRSDGAIVDVALVHRRLSIIDHAGGAQPMVGPVAPTGESASRSVSNHPDAPASTLFHGKPTDSARYQPLPPSTGRIAVVFNGCIYNHRALREELQAAGHRFTTDHSDTEVFIHGWRHWGKGLAPRLDGMFAAAIWDAASGQLLLTRDFAHEKPLCAVHLGPKLGEGLYAFASTPAALVRLATLIGAPTGTRVGAASPDWLGDWARFGASDEPSSIERSWPARAMLHPIETLGRSEWFFDPLPQRSAAGDLSPDRLDALLDSAVKSRLEADVDLGAFLSGGVDSSLVCHYARRAVGTLRTFTVRMPDPRIDESAHAERAARHLGTRHQTLDCDARPAEDLVSLIRTLGVPFGDSSLLPASWVSRAARGAVKVALTGDGGDELFGGYERHVAAIRLARHPVLTRMLGAAPAGLLRRTDARSRASKLHRLVSAARFGYPELLAVFEVGDLRRLMPGCDSGRAGLEPMHEPDPLTTDFYRYLGADLLIKTDAAAMQVGLETRAPLLARAVVDRALREPVESLMPGGRRKGLLRAVARRHLPADIVDRPKQGFAVPIGEWFRTDYGGLRTLLNDHLSSAEPFGPPALGIEIDTAFVRRMVDEHLGMRTDHGQRLYVLLTLSIWARWLGGL